MTQKQNCQPASFFLRLGFLLNWKTSYFVNHKRAVVCNCTGSLKSIRTGVNATLYRGIQVVYAPNLSGLQKYHLLAVEYQRIFLTTSSNALASASGMIRLLCCTTSVVAKIANPGSWSRCVKRGHREHSNDQ